MPRITKAGMVEINNIVQMRTDGRSLREIGACYKVSGERIRQILEKCGYKELKVPLKPLVRIRWVCPQCGKIQMLKRDKIRGRKTCGSKVCRYGDALLNKVAFHAMEMRAAGKTWKDIAITVGYPHPMSLCNHLRQWSQRHAIKLPFEIRKNKQKRPNGWINDYIDFIKTRRITYGDSMIVVAEMLNTYSAVLYQTIKKWSEEHGEDYNWMYVNNRFPRDS